MFVALTIGIEEKTEFSGIKEGYDIDVKSQIYYITCSLVTYIHYINCDKVGYSHDINSASLNKWTIARFHVATRIKEHIGHHRTSGGKFEDSWRRTWGCGHWLVSRDRSV